jgi:hypothetical protein
VYLDDFGELRRIPLDEYRDRVEPFDPRDDGYAERLRSFFVRNGERRIFIPLSFTFSGTAAFEKRLARLGLPPFSLEFLGSPRLLWPEAVLFAVAGALTLILSGTPLLSAALLPLFAALAYGGPAGFALSVVLTALFRVLLDPVRELFIARRYGKPGSLRGPGDRLRPFKALWFLVPGLLILYGIIVRLGAFPPILAFAVLLSFLGLLGICLWAESNRGRNQGHIPFLPVPIRGAFFRSAFFFRSLAPFALASLAALLLPLLLPGLYSPPRPGREPSPVGKADYEAHAAFQVSFSRRSLGEERGDGAVDGGETASYVRYYLGEDGLIAGSRAYEGAFIRGNPESEDIPPFPLEKLVDFSENYRQVYAGNFRWGDTVSVLIALGLGIPGLFRQGRKGRRGRIGIYTEKRIAA